MASRLRIGICGFGVAGGALAVLLARQGHEVTILERAPKLGPVGAGFLLQPSGQRVLQEMGLLDQIISQSARIVRLEAFTASGGQLTDLRYGRIASHLCAYGTHRAILFDTLHSAALAAGAKTVLASEITDLTESAESVTVSDAAGQSHGPFDLVVGADGSRSRLRVWLNPNSPRREYQHGALWATGVSSFPTDALYQMTRGARRLAGLLPIGAGRCTFFWGVQQAEVERLKAKGFAAFREDVVALCPAAEEVMSSLTGFDQFTFGGYQHSLPRRIHSERVVLAGDAAHAMSPHLGQGANLALLDAECLVRHLSEKPISEAIQAYASDRRSQSRYFGLLSRWLSPFFQSESWILGTGRDIALPLLCAIPWMRSQMELSVAGLKRGFFDRLWRR